LIDSINVISDRENRAVIISNPRDTLFSLTEARNMVNDTHTSHFGTNGFEHPWREFILVAQRNRVGRNFPGAYLSSMKMAQKDLLMVPVVWEKDLGLIIQTISSFEFLL